MDLGYAAKLEAASQASEDCFPDLLFEPLTNDFGDLYFKIDIEDYGKNAVNVDPRFTTSNILRMRGSTARIDRYLEWTALWDDYMDYIVQKYGSYEMAEELEEAGLLEDVLPSISHRPLLKRKKLRRLIKRGLVPSFMPYGVTQGECFEHLKHVCDDIPEIKGEEEPDIEWAMNHKLSKEDREVLAKQAQKYRQMHRLEILQGGTSVNGVTSNMDFVDNYYVNMHRGTYDTQFSSDDKGDGLVDQMRKSESRKYRHQGQIWAEEDENSGSRYFYDSVMIRDRRKAERFELLKHLQQYTGIDLMSAMSSHNMSKKAIKAVRVGMESVGASLGLSEKERKKLKKKQRKLEDAQNKSLRADQKLSEVLLNNKVFLNGGTVRFEDMRRWDFDDDF
jgi:hypothetical protein